MKKIICLMNLLLLLGLKQVFAQNTYCDSITIDTIFIDNNMLNITVFNSSQHFIAYPFFTLQLNNNSYIQLNDSVQVLSYLSIPGDANNGFSTGSYLGNIAAANTVPFNTNFSGILTITDPNDSTFSCSYPFSFLYGSIQTSIVKKESENFKLFPNPASNIIYIQTACSNCNAAYIIKDQLGRNAIEGTINNELNTIDIYHLETGIYYVNFLTGNTSAHKLVIIRD